MIVLYDMVLKKYYYYSEIWGFCLMKLPGKYFWAETQEGFFGL